MQFVDLYLRIYCLLVMNIVAIMLEIDKKGMLVYVGFEYTLLLQCAK